MWYFNNNIIKTPRSLTVGDITYPAQIFKDADKLSELGVLPYTEEKVNSKYYWSGELTVTTDNTGATGTYAEIARDVDSLKANMQAEIKSQAASRLNPTDWMTIRAADGGTAVDSATSDYRAAVRTASNTKEDEINALTDIASVIAYENHPVVETRKVKHTDEDGVETYGPETETFDREVSKVNNYEWPVDPNAEVDPAFVSIVDK